MTDAPPPPPVDYSRDRPDDSGARAAVAALIGGVFLWLGWAFAQWLLAAAAGRAFDTGVVWGDGTPLAGMPVAYFDLELGAAWRDFGLFATGVALLTEAALYATLAARPARRRGILGTVFVVAVLGVAANALSIVLQARAGFTAPVFAVIGGVICVLSALSARSGRVQAV